MCRHYICFLSIFCIAVSMNAQNQPGLEIEGSIQIGNDQSSTPDPGTIRWNPSTEDFEGWTGTAWKSLTFSGNEGWGNQAETENCQIEKVGSVEFFSESVAISGDVAIIGAGGGGILGTRGAAYVFEKKGSCWSPVAVLEASDGFLGDSFGSRVSISGDVIVVGARGNNKAYVYAKPVNGWSGSLIQTTQLIASDGSNDDSFGASVSVSGDLVIVGAPFFNTNVNIDQGKAYLYEKPLDGWPVIMAENSKLTASDGRSYDRFGSQVSISGTTAIVGVPKHDTNNQMDQGKVYLYQKPESMDWPFDMVETHQFEASDGTAHDQFGTSISISGNALIVGVLSHDNRIGKAYVYQRSTLTGWSTTESAQLISSDGGEGSQPGTFEYFGRSVSISGNTAVVGASGHDTRGFESAGKAYIYEMPSNGWSSTMTESSQLISSDGTIANEFGKSICISGNQIIVGAEGFNFGEGVLNQGKAYVFYKQN